MGHNEAKQILASSDAEILIDEISGTAKIDGEVTINELHAILQLLEYSA